MLKRSVPDPAGSYCGSYKLDHCLPEWEGETYKCGLMSPLRVMWPPNKSGTLDRNYLFVASLHKSFSCNEYLQNTIHTYIYKIGFFQMCTQINPYGTTMSCYPSCTDV